VQRSTTADASANFISKYPLDPDDARTAAAMRSASSSAKGKLRGVEARASFDALMESVSPSDGVTFKSDAIADVPGLWVHPTDWRADAAILHLHGGWFNFGSANAYRHLVGQIAARAGARAFIPDYRLAPEHPFPAAVDDVLACYRGLNEMAIRRIAIAGDSAGGNLALGLASRVTADASAAKAALVGVAAISPVTDLTLSGATYDTRAEADPYFTRSQVAELVLAYLEDTDPKDPLASPLYARLSELPPIQIHVGDDEVLLDDSRGYIERAVAAGVDAHLHLWMGMAHGFPTSVGKLKASAKALDAIGGFLAEKLS
jgi:acetyl esterase/lipase